MTCYGLLLLVTFASSKKVKKISYPLYEYCASVQDSSKRMNDLVFVWRCPWF